MDPTFLPRQLRRKLPSLKGSSKALPSDVRAATGGKGTNAQKENLPLQPPGHLVVQIACPSALHVLNAVPSSSSSPFSSCITSTQHGVSLPRRVTDIIKSVCERRVSHSVNYVLHDDTELLLRCSSPTKASQLAEALDRDLSQVLREIGDALRVLSAREGHGEQGSTSIDAGEEVEPRASEGRVKHDWADQVQDRVWNGVPQRIVNRAAKRASLADLAHKKEQRLGKKRRKAGREKKKDRQRMETKLKDQANEGK